MCGGPEAGRACPLLGPLLLRSATVRAEAGRPHCCLPHLWAPPPRASGAAHASEAPSCRLRCVPGPPSCLWAVWLAEGRGSRVPPLQPGHTVTVDCQECTCDGVARTLRCRTRPCPPPPVCPELGLVPMPAAPQAGQCCPQYSCGEPWVGGARAASPTSAEGHARTSSGLESFAMRGCGAGSWGPHPRKKVSHCPLLRPPWCPQWSVPPGEPHHLPPGRSGHPETPGGRTGS